MVYFHAEAEAKKENFNPVNSKDKWYNPPFDYLCLIRNVIKFDDKRRFL